MTTVKVLPALAVLLLIGCAPGISKPSRSQVNYTGSFAQLQQDPAPYIGRVVMLGGRIIETKVSKTSSEITILNLPLSWNTRPKEGDASQGRFIVRTKDFADPAIYNQGRLLTVVGQLMCTETRAIGEVSYKYPILAPIEMKLWPAGRDQTGSGVHFGVGVGFGR